ncbi:transcription factor-like protein DPB [Rhododendron vialii]|uniref:transcription factor-like protein DPB n=1 Tax=Rhododendron vialii TaxID=182163 RepID=UPI002660045D|nr:transcription factor-like protein DPB [Rhododendron vialii]
MRAVNYMEYNQSLVGKKVESKGRTTYSEVADEIVAEFIEANSSAVSLDKVEEKNIRRRVYDALNVLMALDIIVNEGKEIRWKGLPSTDVKGMEQNKVALRVKLMNQIGKKPAYLKDLEEQITGLQNLMLRNHHLLASGNSPSGGFSLPFIVVRTNPHATVEIETSEDMQLVHFDFNSTPFLLHDDAYILK